MAAQLRGVDASYFQGSSLNWTTLGQSDVQYATVKITNGVQSQSPNSIAWAGREVPLLRRSAIPIKGGYHTLRPHDIPAQVEWFLTRFDQLFSAVEGCRAVVDVEIWRDAYGTPSHDEFLMFLAEWANESNHYPLGWYYPRWVWQAHGRPTFPTTAKGWLISSDYSDHARGWEPYGGLLPLEQQYAGARPMPGAPSGIGVDYVREGVTFESFRDRTTKRVEPPRRTPTNTQSIRKWNPSQDYVSIGVAQSSGNWLDQYAFCYFPPAERGVCTGVDHTWRLRAANIPGPGIYEHVTAGTRYRIPPVLGY